MGRKIYQLYGMLKFYENPIFLKVLERGFSFDYDKRHLLFCGTLY